MKQAGIKYWFRKDIFPIDDSQEIKTTQQAQKEKDKVLPSTAYNG